MRALLLATFLAPSPAAGTIAGDVRLGEKYLADLPLELKCGAEIVQARTDAAGSFRITVKGGGKCQLTISYEKQAPSIDVVVFEQPAKYRLVIELKDGKYAIKRV